jgi:hypothetical protein
MELIPTNQVFFAGVVVTPVSRSPFPQHPV